MGPLTVSSSKDSTKSTWNKILFPDKKEEIEKYIFHRFLYHKFKIGVRIISVSQNKEDDFDFTVEVPSGKRYIDLAEITLPSSGDPYKNDRARVRNAEFTESVRKIVEEKNQKYRSIANLQIDLLFYITHWRFRLSDHVIMLLQYDLAKTDHQFKNIMLYEPIDKKEGRILHLYPIPDNFYEGYDMEALRKLHYYNSNLTENGTTIVID